MESIIEFFNHILNELHNLPETSDNYWERIVQWLIIVYFEIKLSVLEFSYSIAMTFIDAAGLSESINSAWGSISPEVFGTLSYLRVPEALNMVLSAVVTRFIMDLLP